MEGDEIMSKTHGLSKSRIYNTWIHMIRRCTYTKDISFNRYGGRGISVCDEWKNSFESFYKWAMSNGYSDNLTIERENNDGNYEPSNCKWITNKEQMRNLRNNVIITCDGKTQLLMDWLKEKNIKRTTYYSRIANGWTIEQALKVPVHARGNDSPRNEKGQFMKKSLRTADIVGGMKND